MIRLPIDDVVPDLVEALRRSASVVLRAPTGAGKTTRVPPALLAAGLNDGRQIVLLQPRRIAARTAARRMADERGEPVGETIGFQIRFERKSSRATQILVVTEGILTRMLQEDPFLERVGIVVLDEFHERHLDSDLALGMLRRVQMSVRDDLRIVVMSATMAAAPVADYLGGCPIVESEGRLFPVEIEYRESGGAAPLALRVVDGVRHALARTEGDVLAFLPGVGEIRQTHRALQATPEAGRCAVHQLFGEMAAADQDAALRPGPQRKIVLATNVAETSVTIEGITAVVDSGMARILQFNPHVGLDRLKLTSISKASADQRAGRAGRLRPGLCLRLWSEAAQRARPDHETPEIRRVDLSGPVLQLRCWGESDIAAFPWFEPPRGATLARADRLLRQLGALDAIGPTELGRRMSQLPVPPRMARLLLEGANRGVAAQAAMAAALLSERDPFRAGDEMRGSSDGNSAHRSGSRRPATRSDLLDRIHAMEEFERSGRESTSLGTLQPASARFVLKARDQLLRALPSSRSVEKTPTDIERADLPDERLLRAIWTAYPDRLTRRREGDSSRGVMVGGKGVALGHESAVRAGEFFVGLDLDAGDGEAKVRMASVVERDWIDHDRLATSIDLEFDAVTERLSARRRVRYEDLILEESPAAVPSGEAASLALADAARRHWERVYPPEDPAVEAFVTRVRCLGVWMPECEWPGFTTDELQNLLPLLTVGCRTLADVRKAAWLDILRMQLKRDQLAALEREAPERMLVPSGNRIALHYELGRPPVLAVRIQEVFGWSDTPRIAGGRVRVLLHLLAPNQRPQQITDDLASFWKNGYPLVRKELRARYPKHSWPDDPSQAPPQRRPTRR